IWGNFNIFLDFKGDLGSYHWISALAHMTKFPHYNTTGIQTIDVLEKIPTTIPIIILHSKRDHVVSCDDGYAIYQKFQMMQHKELYFFPSERYIHIDMVRNRLQKRESKKGFGYKHIYEEVKNISLGINQIYARNLLPFKRVSMQSSPGDNTQNTFDFKRVQPEFEINYYEPLLERENSLRLSHSYLPQLPTIISIQDYLPLLSTLHSVYLKAIPVTMFLVAKYLASNKS
ncbi:MAG: hypothetical protein V4482_01350, partial [Pseudomonadota bacterium]